MIRKRETVFRTKWFEVEAKHTDADAEPFYSLKLPDYVAIVAYTAKGEMVLVRQYRPAIDAATLELPSGLVDGADDAEATARRELEEETGYRIAELQHLGTLYSDTGRLQNRLWCYVVKNVKPIPGWKTGEKGIETVVMSPDGVNAAIRDGRFKHALHLAALHLAALRVADTRG
jgi:ADP-ribose pyrophosphatase